MIPSANVRVRLWELGQGVDAQEKFPRRFVVSVEGHDIHHLWAFAHALWYSGLISVLAWIASTLR